MTFLAWMIIVCTVLWALSGFFSILGMDAWPDWITLTLGAISRLSMLAVLICIGWLILWILGVRVSIA